MYIGERERITAITFKIFMSLYENWDNIIVVKYRNNIIEDTAIRIMQNNQGLFNKKVKFFGIYRNVLHVRLDDMDR